MPPRLNKRQQREQDEILALEQQGLEVNDKPDSPTKTTKRPLTGFSALGSGDGLEEESEEEVLVQTSASKSKKSGKKKKKKPSAPVTTEAVSLPATPDSSKKGKGKAKVKDEVDQALEELSRKYPEMHLSPSPASQPAVNRDSRCIQTIRSLLSVSFKNLDSEAELRRFFGSKVISASKPPSRSSARSNLIRPKPGWPPSQMRQGLVMRPLKIEEVARKGDATYLDGDKWFTIDHSLEYRSTQSQFLQCVTSYDPSNLIALLQVYPWHVDTLLQLSEVYKHNEEYNIASDFIERALFAYERSFIATFNLTLGASRLDFDRIENRSLFLALHRNVIDLQRRGCLRTAFEFARLLLALDPCSDPHGALLHLDYLALKTKMHQWLLDMWDIWARYSQEKAPGPDDDRVDVRQIPGWAFSRALALHTLEEEQGDLEHKQSIRALEDAIVTFPGVVLVLCDKAGITLPPAAHKHKALQTQTAWVSSQPGLSCLHFLAQIYANRAASLWKAPPTGTWFQNTLTDHLLEVLLKPEPRRNQAKAHWATPSLSLSVLRHAVVCDLRPLSAFYASRAAHVLAFDPFPPTTSVSAYDVNYFNGVTPGRPRRGPVAGRRRANGEVAAIQILEALQRLARDPEERERFRIRAQGNIAGRDDIAARDEIMQWVARHPQLREQFPDAIALLEEAGAHRGDELDLDESEEEEEEGEQDENQAVGGGAADPELDGEDPSTYLDDGEGSEEDIAPGMLPRIFQNVMNMFWGGRDVPPQDPETPPT